MADKDKKNIKDFKTFYTYDQSIFEKLPDSIRKLASSETTKIAAEIKITLQNIYNIFNYNSFEDQSNIIKKESECYNSAACYFLSEVSKIKEEDKKQQYFQVAEELLKKSLEISKDFTDEIVDIDDEIGDIGDFDLNSENIDNNSIDNFYKEEENKNLNKTTNNEIALSNLGVLYLNQGKDEEAKKCFDELIKNFSSIENPIVLNNIGVYCLKCEEKGNILNNEEVTAKKCFEAAEKKAEEKLQVRVNKEKELNEKIKEEKKEKEKEKNLGIMGKMLRFGYKVIKKGAEKLNIISKKIDSLKELEKIKVEKKTAEISKNSIEFNLKNYDIDSKGNYSELKMENFNGLISNNIAININKNKEIEKEKNDKDILKSLNGSISNLNNILGQSNNIGI